MKQIVFLVISVLFVSQLNAQSHPIKTLKFGVPINTTMSHPSGLQVKNILTTSRLDTRYLATLEGAPDRCEIKNVFAFFIEVTNTGPDDILITDWHFQVNCPENNMAQQWDEKSYIKLITPVISNSLNILLKKNEKKSFFTPETDFFWCSPAHQEALTTEPCTITALITCAQIGSTSNSSPVGFHPNNCLPHNYSNTPPPCPPRNPSPSSPPGTSSSTGSGGSSSTNTTTDSSSSGDNLLATYINENGQWVAIGPYMSTGGFDTEQQAINSLFYTNADLTLLADRGKYTIYKLNVPVLHGGRDVRSILTALGVLNIPY